MPTQPTTLLPEKVLTGFARRTLTHAEWTHEAHLSVCWYAVTMLGPVGAMTHLREEIASFNASIGVENTEHGGYHDTLTGYYVDAVAAVDADRPADLFEHPWCSRTAPLRHWSRDRLFSPLARAGWAAPDLEPLPW
jgi:uncharacterized protein CbrC (UPF0167 family)